MQRILRRVATGDKGDETSEVASGSSAGFSSGGGGRQPNSLFFQALR